MKPIIGLLLALMLASCGGSSGGGSSGTSFPTPVAGQWSSAFGAVTTSNLGTSFSIPSNTAGVHYVYAAPPQNLATAKSITLNYSLTGNATFAATPQAAPATTDIMPATITLFMWENGDNLSCSGAYNYYRMFAPGSKVNLTYGLNQTITAPLNPANWQGCTPGAVPQANWSQLMANPFAVGFTFSGQWFDGHGIYAATGNATFTINSFTVQ